jgi:flagellar motility protein MotE (MotC chaperone)
MGLIDIGTIIVAVVAALGAWAAQRSAANASKVNVETSGRLDAEKGAYERARIFDLETIDRQNEELGRLREENEHLKEELAAVRERLATIEHLIPEWERLLHENLNESDNPEQ